MTGRRHSALRSIVRDGVLLPMSVLVIAVSLFLFHIAWYEYSWYFSIGFLIAAAFLIFFCWFALRIWEFVVAPLIGPERHVVKALTRVPFGILGSAIGYTTGMLMAKKGGVLEFWDQPVARIFSDGVLLGIIVHAVHDLLRLVIDARIASHSISSQNDESHDKSRTT